MNQKRRMHTAMMLAIGAILAAQATGSKAGIVYFENPPEGDPGHFNWHWQNPFEYDEATFEHWLDITRPSTNQFDLANPNSVGQLSVGRDLDNWTSGGAEVAWIDEQQGETRAFKFGEEISDDAMFNTISLHLREDNTSEFEPMTLAYIGVKTGSGNFGWIAVERRGEPGDFPDDHQFRAFGWAYETIPGKPILAGQIPAPGAVAPLALAGIVFARRRRERA